MQYYQLTETEANSREGAGGHVLNLVFFVRNVTNYYMYLPRQNNNNCQIDHEVLKSVFLTLKSQELAYVGCFLENN